MDPRIRSIVCLMVSFMLLGGAAAAQMKEGSITGRVSLATPAGDVLYGDWVRVFLTTKPIAVPAVDLSSIEVPIERQSRINSGHMDFFVNFQHMQGDNGYIVDNKLTRPDGTFAFYGVPAGRYWVLVTFPTIIAGYKCAWQAPVEVAGDGNVHVELNDTNLAVPAY